MAGESEEGRREFNRPSQGPSTWHIHGQNKSTTSGQFEGLSKVNSRVISGVGKGLRGQKW